MNIGLRGQRDRWRLVGCRLVGLRPERAVSGALLLSAARALWIWASRPGAQNSDQFELPLESGTNDWHAKLFCRTCAANGNSRPIGIE